MSLSPLILSHSQCDSWLSVGYSGIAKNKSVQTTAEIYIQHPAYVQHIPNGNYDHNTLTDKNILDVHFFPKDHDWSLFYKQILSQCFYFKMSHLKKIVN